MITAAAPHEGILDMRVLRDLCELDLGHGDDFLRLLLDTFAADARGTLERMRACILRGDAESVAREAHRLKGSSGSLGAMRFACACLDIERRARGAARQDLDELVGIAALALDATHERFRQLSGSGDRGIRAFSLPTGAHCGSMSPPG